MLKGFLIARPGDSSVSSTVYMDNTSTGKFFSTKTACGCDVHAHGVVWSPERLLQVVEKCSPCDQLVGNAVKSRTRRTEQVAARMVVAALMRMAGTGVRRAYTYKQIGQALGGRDHTTIISLMQNVEYVSNRPDIRFLQGWLFHSIMRRVFDQWREDCRRAAE